MVALALACSWDGRPLPAASQGMVFVHALEGGLRVRFDVPHFGDPPPAAPPGPTARLWEHEVVELFVAGPHRAYFELELGPHGHHLALQLSDVRQVERSGLPLRYSVGLARARARGEARVPRDYLPAPPWRVNAYAIHRGSCLADGSTRCHHAHAAVPGPAPDFHQLDRFVVPWR